MLRSLVLLATTPTPTPTTPVDPNLVTPGPWGFAVIAVIAVAVILLIWDMMRRIRRGRVRADLREELEAERQAAEAGSGAETGETPDAAGDDTPR